GRRPAGVGLCISRRLCALTSLAGRFASYIGDCRGWASAYVHKSDLDHYRDCVRLGSLVSLSGSQPWRLAQAERTWYCHWPIPAAECADHRTGRDRSRPSDWSRPNDEELLDATAGLPGISDRAHSYGSLFSPAAVYEWLYVWNWQAPSN